MQAITTLRLLTFISAMLVLSSPVAAWKLPLTITVSQPNVMAQKGGNSNDTSARISQIIAVAEEHFDKGIAYLKSKARESASKEFDMAIDSILESGLDIRSTARLQTYYLQLVERVYRVEVAPEQVRQQGVTSSGAELQVDTSPLDELSKLELTEAEKSVSPEEIAKLEAQLKAVLAFEIRPNPLIQQFIKYHQGRGRATMEMGLRLSGRYLPMMRRIFREEGVPEDIVWLVQMLSRWNVRAFSSNGAAGLWQFAPDTAGRFGLRQTPWIDERFSFEKATRAAARYLKFLFNRYGGNWELAISAYVTREGLVDRAVRRAGVLDFWSIYPHLPSETRDYVPNLFATVMIATGRDRAGFSGIRSMPALPLAYDTLSVPSATSLNLIASLSDTSVEFIRSINLHLTGDTTPPGEECILNVPPGRGRQIVTLLKRIPIDRRNNDVLVIPVAPGEDLKAVARRTRINVIALRQWNGGVDLSGGGKLVVPIGSNADGENQCALGVERVIELRGFRLGMSINDALSELPQLTSASASSVLQGTPRSENAIKNEFGIFILAIEITPGDKSRGGLAKANSLSEKVSDDYVTSISPNNLPRFNGISKIILWFLDERLTSLHIEYETGIKWESVNEFIEQVAKTLDLYGTWKADVTYGSGKTLTCNGLSITANIEQQSLVPSLTLKELNSWQLLVRRQEEKAKKEEKQKKESFIP